MAFLLAGIPAEDDLNSYESAISCTLTGNSLPIEANAAAESLDWMDIGLARDHGPWARPGNYTPCDVINVEDEDGLPIALVLAQRGNADDPPEWHLHQDLVVALNLKREGDKWLSMDEGYTEVAKVTVVRVPRSF